MKIINCLLLSAAFGDLIGLNRLSNRLCFHNAHRAQFQSNLDKMKYTLSPLENPEKTADLKKIKKARYIKRMKNDN